MSGKTKLRKLLAVLVAGVVLFFGVGGTPLAEAATPVFPIRSGWTKTSDFGWRIHPVTGERSFHTGVDIGAPLGTEVVAALDGVVTFAGWRGAYGQLIEIDHGDGYSTRYAHLSAILVQYGQIVRAGQVIGLVGSTGRSTGPHLHFEFRIEGEPVTPALLFKELGGKQPFGIGPIARGNVRAGQGATDGAMGLVEQFLQQLLGGMRGEINHWLIGIFLSLLLMIVLPAQALTDFNGMLDQMINGQWKFNNPTVLFPWKIDVSGGVNGLSVTIGVILWLFAVLRAAHDIAEGKRENPVKTIYALVTNLGLILAAPIVVKACAAIYNLSYRTILESLPEAVRHNTGTLLFATLGLEDWQERAIFFGLAGLGFLAEATKTGSQYAATVGEFGRIILGLPTLLLVFWCIVMMAVGIQTMFAMLFIGLTPYLSWLFGLFGDSWDFTRKWIEAIGRAFLACGIVAATAALWLGMAVNKTLDQSFLGSISTPLISSLAYIVVAVLIWTWWTRRALLMIYEALPAIGRTLMGAGTTTEFAGRVAAALPGGTALGVAMVGASGHLRRWGQVVDETRSRLQNVVSGKNDASGLSLDSLSNFFSTHIERLPKQPADWLQVESVGPMDGIVEGKDGEPLRRRIRVRNEEIGDLYEKSLKQSYGEENVIREDATTFLVPLTFNKQQVLQKVQSELQGKLPVVRSNGTYRAFVNGTWVIIPSSWIHNKKDSIIFLGDTNK